MLTVQLKPLILFKYDELDSNSKKISISNHLETLSEKEKEKEVYSTQQIEEILKQKHFLFYETGKRATCEYSETFGVLILTHENQRYIIKGEI